MTRTACPLSIAEAGVAVRPRLTTPPEDRAPGTGEFVVYTGDDGKAHVQIRLLEGSVWMTQRQIAEVFGVSVPTINEHLAGIYVEEELDPARTVRQVRIVQTEGSRFSHPLSGMWR